MKKELVPIAAAILTLVTAATRASSMPLPPFGAVQASSVAAEPVAHRRGFYAVGGVWYYNGHRGFVVARPGYRYYRGYWFPAAAFAAGAAAGAAVTAAPAPYRRLAAAHAAWCYETYRSYRAWDNTYQPYDGPRRRCCRPTADTSEPGPPWRGGPVVTRRRRVRSARSGRRFRSSNCRRRVPPATCA